MLTDPKLKSQVDPPWDKFWSSGLTNPLGAIEQFSYLLFLKRMDDAENRREKLARKLGQASTPGLAENLRWGCWTNLKADEALRHLKEVIFPDLRRLGAAGSSFERYMVNAECKISNASLLIDACKRAFKVCLTFSPTTA